MVLLEFVGERRADRSMFNKYCCEVPQKQRLSPPNYTHTNFQPARRVVVMTRVLASPRRQRDPALIIWLVPPPSGQSNQR
jgi:hypothetical protein